MDPARRRSAATTARFWVYDSLLSEYAALGFEYGYAQSSPETLVLWEAQFGDFINGAQVIIDQYLVAAEDKWGQRNGLVLLLPHGYEGQGPEHSLGPHRALPASLRAEDNIQVVQRHDRGAVLPPAAPPGAHGAPHSRWSCSRPKQGLRMKQTRSPHRRAHHRLVPGGARRPGRRPIRERCERVVFCSGKVAWDAMAERDKREAPVAVVRVEQLYPLPDRADARRCSQRYANARELVWLQEEPENMGAWRFIEHRTWRVKEQGYDMRRVARVESGSPATGSKAIHDQELADLMDETFS